MDQLVVRLFEKAGTSRQDAELMARLLVRTELSGGLEWQRERDYALHGIPISPGHKQSLEEIAAELGIETPFVRYEHTCFGT